jgi:hypothetical protein
MSSSFTALIKSISTCRASFFAQKMPTACFADLPFFPVPGTNLI